GINEIPRVAGDDALRVLEAFAHRTPTAGVVAADRLVRRSLPSGRWQLATIAELSDEVIEDATASRGITVSAPRELLHLAFFLNLAVNSQVEGNSVSKMFEAFLLAHMSSPRTEPTQVSA